MPELREARLEPARRRHREREAKYDGLPAHPILGLALARARRRRWRDLGRVLAEDAAHAAAAGDVPDGHTSAVIDRFGGAVPLRELVRAALENARCDLRAVTADELARQIRSEIDPSRHSHRRVLERHDIP